MRKAHKNTITLNGRIYDVKTGQVVGGAAKHHPSPAPAHLTEPIIITPRAKKTTHASNVTSIPVRDANRTNGQKATTIHVTYQRPKTLMRHAVKKPLATPPKQTATGLAAQPVRIVINGPVTEREKRAAQTLQSKHVTKFATPHAGVVHKTAEIPVKTSPHLSSTPHTPKEHYDIHDTPPPPIVPAHPMHTPKRDIFEEALSHATSHQAHKRRSSRSNAKRRTQLAAGVASVILLAGFFMYQNTPKIALARATSTIGFNAQVPSYRPAGFTQNSNIQYQKGLVVIDFHSTSDQRSYTVTQSKTTQQNAKLGQEYLQPQQKYFDKTEVKGKTIYVYGGSNATWIDNGVWFTIEGNANLSRSQLVNIIASI